MESACLVEITHEALETVAARASERGVVLRHDIPEDLPGIEGSPKRLRRLLINLLDNGIKFSPKDGHVKLALFDDPACIRIEVADMGRGIPPHHLPHIFEDYFRVRRREFVPGAGIGLSTARRIVEAHGGQIWVQSPYRSDQTGSKFICTLPKSPRVAGSDLVVDPLERGAVRQNG
jgi:signal transduction histidine kinase